MGAQGKALVSEVDATLMASGGIYESFSGEFSDSLCGLQPGLQTLKSESLHSGERA